jgi:hypothetical protein
MNEDLTYCITGCDGSGEIAILPTNLNYTVIFDDLFKGHKELTHVEFPDTVLDLGGFILDGCENVKELTLPPHLQNLWQYSLTRCGIEEIVIPGSVERIIPYVFNQCKNLHTVTIKEGTKKILSWAFKDCINLKDVYLPASIEEIGEHAFDGCPNVILHHKGKSRESK